jgi:outer membrane receptor protein involved in Fe transport
MKRLLSNKLAIFMLLIAFMAFGNVFMGADDTIKESEKVQESKDKSQEEEAVEQSEKEPQKEIVLHEEVIVTATRTEKTLINVPQPVNVVNQERLVELAPNNISDLLPEMPGTDVVGVGPNQSRPIIRGLRGQRILLLSDGIRLSNSRRTQDFGEIPSLVDISGMERVEVVRGPASVLYGSEAIGGVVNMITLAPNYGGSGTHIFGNLGYRYSSVGAQNKVFANLNGNIDNFSFMFSGTYRKADAYMAPEGSFGNINLSQNTLVNDTGVQDNGFNLFFGYRFNERSDVSLKYEYYDAKDAGFGYVDPAVYAPGDPTIQLLYPEQKMRKLSLRYDNRGIDFALADSFNLTGYYMSNKRIFDTNITIPFSPRFGLSIQSSNFTDVGTVGARFEFRKALFEKHVLTYGLDFYQDDSENTDESASGFYGFGPFSPSIDSTPNVPNAFLRSFGLFLQDDIPLFDRSSLILGVRYQNVHAETKQTPGFDGPLVESTDSTLVGSANFLFGVTDDFKLIASVGRGFRSPNLPERFFNGVTPDGSGFQIANPDLKAESSLNLDLGARYSWDTLYVEATYFRNMVYDGIQIAPTGNMVGRLPEYRNVNVQKLRLQGFEALVQINFDFGLMLTSNYNYFISNNLTNPELPYSDTYGSRLNVNLRYNFPKDIFWIEYHVRYSGEQKDVQLVENPIGDVLPSFTVHSLRGGITLFKGTKFPQQLGITIGNLTNTLYSEFSNTSFFRPGPRRHILLTWSTRF